MRFWVCFVSTLLRSYACLFPAFAQTDVNDVHVMPREVEKPKDTPKPDLLHAPPPG